MGAAPDSPALLAKVGDHPWAEIITLPDWRRLPQRDDQRNSLAIVNDLHGEIL
jgi:hypothetical protein